jgi:hypothetical protein
MKACFDFHMLVANVFLNELKEEEIPKDLREKYDYQECKAYMHDLVTYRKRVRNEALNTGVRHEAVILALKYAIYNTEDSSIWKGDIWLPFIYDKIKEIAIVVDTYLINKGLTVIQPMLTDNNYYNDTFCVDLPDRDSAIQLRNEVNDALHERYPSMIVEFKKLV